MIDLTAKQRIRQMGLQALSSKPKRGLQRGPQEWHKTDECHGCGEVGHIKLFCPNKNKTDAKTGSEDSPVPISSARIKELASRVERRDHNAGYSAMVCGATCTPELLAAMVCGAIPALLEQRDQVCGTRPQHDGVGLVAQRIKLTAAVAINTAADQKGTEHMAQPDLDPDRTASEVSSAADGDSSTEDLPNVDDVSPSYPSPMEDMGCCYNENIPGDRM